MTIVPIELYWCFVLAGAASLVLALDLSSAPIGFININNKPHLALIAILFTAMTAAYSFPRKAIEAIQSQGLISDNLTYLATFLCSIILLLSIILALFQMRLRERERGVGYAILLLTLMSSVLLNMVQNVVWFVIAVNLSLTFFVALTPFRKNLGSSSEVAAKLTVSMMFWLVFAGIALALIFSAHSDADFYTIAFLSQHATYIEKSAVVFTFISVFYFMGIAPFYGVHIDYLDEAPKFAALGFAGAVLLPGSIVLLRLLQSCKELLEQESILLYLLVGLAAYGICMPAIRAADQIRVGRMCVYLVLTQPGVVMATALTYSLGEATMAGHINLVLINMVLAISGVFVGITFWQTKLVSYNTWEEYAGAGQKHPIASFAWLLCLGSLVGLPGTLGFSSRMNVIIDAATNGNLIVAIALGAGLVLGAVPVFRLALFLYAKPTGYELARHHQPRHMLLLIACGALIFVGGLFPKIFDVFHF